MKLNEVELKLKEDIEVIFSGGYDDSLSPEQVEYCKVMSFLYNHIRFESGDIIFFYDDINLKIRDVDMDDFSLYMGVNPKDHIISLIKNTEEFKSAYNRFLRDRKINNILSGDE
jgi:hypothetical protein